MSLGLRSRPLSDYYLGAGILAFFLLVAEGYTFLAGNVIS